MSQSDIILPRVSFARLNYKTMNFQRHVSLKFIYGDGETGNRVKGRKETEKVEEGKKRGRRMKRKWFSKDGLSSEVRLNRTEVNNGCLTKGRSSQSGSNKKKKKRERKRKKRQKQKTA